MGFVVSKKIGIAVVRNRVTRRLREIARPLLGRLPTDAAVVVRALPGIQDQRFDELEDQVRGALGSATRKLERRRQAADREAVR